MDANEIIFFWLSVLEIFLKNCFANEIRGHLLSQWNISLYANDLFHWHPKRYFHDDMPRHICPHAPSTHATKLAPTPRRPVPHSKTYSRPHWYDNASSIHHPRLAGMIRMIHSPVKIGRTYGNFQLLISENEGHVFSHPM